MKVLERVANVAVILAVAVFLTLVIRGEFFRHAPAPSHEPSALVGKTLRLPGLHFPAQRDTLLLVVSTSCHFCNESLPFYRQLTAQLQGKVDTVAVLAQTKTEAEAWLQGAGLSQVQIVSAPLESVGVYATPTLLLLDRTAKVQSGVVVEECPGTPTCYTVSSGPGELHSGLY